MLNNAGFAGGDDGVKEDQTPNGVSGAMHKTLMAVAQFVGAENKALEAKRIFDKFDSDSEYVGVSGACACGGREGEGVEVGG
jgi:hypothetical protein